jgi:hypothetical protein
MGGVRNRDSHKLHFDGRKVNPKSKLDDRTTNSSPLVAREYSVASAGIAKVRASAYNLAQVCRKSAGFSEL